MRPPRHDDGADRTLLERYRQHVEARPDNLAVVDDVGRRYTHRQLWDRADAYAKQLGALATEPRQLVLLRLPNLADYQAVFLGVLIAGMVPATVPATVDAPSLTAILEIGRARLLVLEGGPGQLHEAVAAAASTRWACVPGVLGTDGLVTAAATSGQLPPGHATDLAHLMFTSSTTGEPKAVHHDESSLAALNHGFTERFALSGSSPLFMPSPLGHSVGGIHGIRLALYLGAPLVLQHRWDPQVAFRLVDEHACEFTAAATPFLKDVVDARSSRPKFASLRTFLCGGAQVPPALLDRARTELPDTFVTVLWGMTEGGVTTCVPGDRDELIRDTAGCGLPGLELRILDPDARPLPDGAEGELAMRGPGVFQGYLDREELYRSLLTDDGFFRTGDRGRLVDGYLQVTGRVKDLIVRGGVNLSPVPTENALFRHPDVLAVAVVGAPDDRLGERICAVVQSTRDLTLDEAVAWCAAEGLPKRLWPERLVTVAEVPRTAAGKIRKVELRERLFGTAEVTP